MYFLIYSVFAWEPKQLNGRTVTWAERTVPYYINTERMDSLSVSEIETAIQDAADAWNSSSFETEEASFQFSYQGDTKSNTDLADDEFVISFDNSWTQGEAVLAVTHIWSDAEGEISHFDIEVNIDNVEWTTTGEEGKHDLQNSMTHEFGHALGLDHSDDEEATMAATTSEGEVSKRDLHQDDILGVVSLYPAGEAQENSEETNEDSQENSQGSSQGGGAVDNSISGPSNTGSGAGPVALEKSGCSATPSSALWLGIIALLQIRRRHN